MTTKNIKELVEKMTLEEKASLCSGADFWHTQKVERLGIPASMVADGPHGLRKQDEKADHLGINESIKAVCFPAGCGLAASFNKELLTQVGDAIGNECQAEGVSVLLGPAVNIKRSPLCGRNFEYYSEDPVVASKMAGAFIKGVQGRNVGTSIKHFLANNQETRRLSVSAQIDERTLHEIYLAAFEEAVKEEKPWTVMCSYNKINGVYAARNRKYLTEVLREQWGFDGYVMSDWGAVDERVADLQAGLDLEMPSSAGVNNARIVEAVKQGLLAEETLDIAVERILNMVFRYEENRDRNAVFDRDQDHEKARRAAEETVVLLKNDGILPLKEGARIAFIGKYAAKPRYQGGGSSHINSHRVTSAMDAAAGNPYITYAQGFTDGEDRVDGALQEQALAAAAEAEYAVIFAGLPDAFESESFDRKHMRLPDCQNELIKKVLAVQPHTVVVLHNGAPVELPWADRSAGILEAYLGGQAIGGAVYDILFGKVNPSGKLAETFPLRLEDNPSYLTFPGEGDLAVYAEGIFVGYRYYDKKKMPVQFPFGHGLSYTTFSYSNLRVSAEVIRDTEQVTISADITNTGDRSGKEAVQLYVGAKEGAVIRPVKELRDFAKLSLEPLETKQVSFTLDRRAFSYYDTELHDWYAPTGEYELMLASSSRDIRLQKTVRLEATVRRPVTYTMDSIMEDIFKDPRAKALVMETVGDRIDWTPVREEGPQTQQPPQPQSQQLSQSQSQPQSSQSQSQPVQPESRQPQTAGGKDGASQETGSAASEAISAKMQEAIIYTMPLHGIVTYGGGSGLTVEDVELLLERLNGLSQV